MCPLVLPEAFVGHNIPGPELPAVRPDRCGGASHELSQDRSVLHRLALPEKQGGAAWGRREVLTKCPREPLSPLS